MKRILILIFVALSVAKPVLALGRVVSYNDVQTNLFGSIQSTSACGSWGGREKAGEFRLIRLYYSEQEMLFVDIVAIKEDSSELEVLRGFSFSEINNDHAEITLGSIECETHSENAIEVSGFLNKKHDLVKYEFSIVLNGKSNTYTYKEKQHNK